MYVNAKGGQRLTYGLFGGTLSRRHRCMCVHVARGDAREAVVEASRESNQGCSDHQPGIPLLLRVARSRGEPRR